MSSGTGKPQLPLCLWTHGQHRSATGRAPAPLQNRPQSPWQRGDPCAPPAPSLAGSSFPALCPKSSTGSNSNSLIQCRLEVITNYFEDQKWNNYADIITRNTQVWETLELRGRWSAPEAPPRPLPPCQRTQHRGDPGQASPGLTGSGSDLEPPAPAALSRPVPQGPGGDTVHQNGAELLQLLWGSASPALVCRSLQRPRPSPHRATHSPLCPQSPHRVTEPCWSEKPPQAHPVQP